MYKAPYSNENPGSVRDFGVFRVTRVTGVSDVT